MSRPEFLKGRVYCTPPFGARAPQTEVCCSEYNKIVSAILLLMCDLTAIVRMCKLLKLKLIHCAKPLQLCPSVQMIRTFISVVN